MFLIVLLLILFINTHFPTYGHLLTGYQVVHGANVYFSENQAENGKLYTDTVTPDGRTADHVGIIR